MSCELFADRLVDQIKKKQSIICVGLDPRIGEKSTIPQSVLDKVGHDNNEAIWEFNKGIIDHTHEITPIYKPQIAFYEQYDAMDALKRTIDYIHEKGALALLDAKRNDIGSTSGAYAKAVFEHLGADAVTVNSYFGIDGVAPFLKYISAGKGVIVLLKTSNKSSGEFQDLFSVGLNEIGPETIETTVDKTTLARNYIHMTRLMVKWSEDSSIVGEGNESGKSGYSSLGGVVGATYPAQMKAVRKEAPLNFILIPGYGAQGGTAADILHGLNADGLGAIVNASRSINFAYQSSQYKDLFTPEQFGEAAGQAAKDMQQAINHALKNAGKIAY
ncbi:orotidine-5'-phosphate decarboxylase [Candidatus Lokiarchaeum ossiferum]|uniref:orotidine-5'-phosphate decarboxylase n=1 Tax=Candidatus Lokiarchaeum ossiferum TaxID=2951803 RepID=UPI00352BE378